MTAAAKKNGKVLSSSTEPQKEETKEGKVDTALKPLGMADLFSKELWLISTIMFLCWPIGSHAEVNHVIFP